ncbi:hypothetical protein BLNAU_10027 [Blattamonas nauphoetae]|uniref:Uncharacterized protein n=1 Tax=Blattamonas nauphoetae TaxID=2049346 RepID=A0ABQ9XUF5_9EUKA|nr:hypothetical protein BLNAU_10027 [Blattamonas nauphoetae]
MGEKMKEKRRERGEKKEVRLIVSTLTEKKKSETRPDYPFPVRPMCLTWTVAVFSPVRSQRESRGVGWERMKGRMKRMKVRAAHPSTRTHHMREQMWTERDRWKKTPVGVCCSNRFSCEIGTPPHVFL